MKILSLLLFFLNLVFFNHSLLAEEWILSPTHLYLTKYPLEEIKYNLRLDKVTFEYKSLYDKAIGEEKLGFFGYYGSSIDFLIYQDIIRIIFEELFKFSIPTNFHFLAVPLFPERKMQSLDDLAKTLFIHEGKVHHIKKQFFPFNLSLYANHKTLGFCPAKNFFLKSKPENMQDLEWLFSELGMENNLIQKAFLIGKTYFENEDRVLLQLFDLSHVKEDVPYQMIDHWSYPASPQGYPYHNQSLSTYIFDQNLEFPPQFFLMMDPKTILNPESSLFIKRYTKIQPSKINAYETELRNLIKTANYDVDKLEIYKNQLIKIYYQ